MPKQLIPASWRTIGNPLAPNKLRDRIRDKLLVDGVKGNADLQEAACSEQLEVRQTLISQIDSHPDEKYCLLQMFAWYMNRAFSLPDDATPNK